MARSNSQTGRGYNYDHFMDNSRSGRCYCTDLDLLRIDWKIVERQPNGCLFDNM